MQLGFNTCILVETSFTSPLAGSSLHDTCRLSLMTLSRALEIFLNLEKPCVFSGYRLAHPKPVALWWLQHLSCELKIDDCNPRRCLCSLLSTRASVRHSSLFGSPEEMKLVVVRSLAWWFAVDLFSTKCAPTACSVLISWARIYPGGSSGCPQNTEVSAERDFRDKSTQLPHFSD